MKHNSLISANGFHTPIASTTVKSSVLTTIFKPLLLLLLLMVGSSAVWAGWRFQGQNGSDENWSRSDNMTQVGSSDVWYYKIINLSSEIQFKINNGSWDNENQKYWEANHDDQNRGNVTLQVTNEDDSKHRFKYSPSYNFGSNLSRDVYIFVKGDANNPSANDRVWAIAVRPGSGTINKQYSLRGDLWLDNGWAGSSDYNHNPVFVNMTNNVAAQVSYLIPIPSGDNAMKSRFTLVSAGSDKAADHYEAESSNLTNSSNENKYRLTIPANGGSYPTVKRIVIDYYPTNGYVRARLEDYIVKRTGWHLYVDDKYMGAMDNNGSFTFENMASGEHTMYIANYSHNSINSSTYDPYNDNGGKVHAQQWFGGLFIDVNPEHSNVSFSNKSVYYDSDVNKFGPQTYPIAGQTNARGRFTISGTKDVIFTFDGGVITINAYEHGAAPEPNPDITYTGNEFMFLSKQQKNSGDGNIFNFTADGAHLFVYFWNSETSANAWSDEAFMWDSGDNVLGAKVPAGTWTNCKVVRKNSNDSGKNWNNVWNESHNQTLEAGKNYLRTGESSVWAVYTPPFYLTGSNALCGAEWGYTGNGTTYNGSATRTNIPAGTYQFKLNPTKNYNDWAHQINYTHVASSGSNVTLSSHSDNQIQFTLSEASDVTIAYDGYGVTVNATPYAPPAVTRTVTIHPNNGAANFTMDVADGGTISSIAATYGNGTASWYKDAELTQAFTLNSSTVTEDMDLYAKWGVSGNYWLVGDQWMYDTGSSWNNDENPAFTTTDGVATVTFIAPMGRNRFEIIKDNNWGLKINSGNYAAVVNSASPVAISVADGHMEFTLDEMKKVTIIYDGKVSVRAEAYDIHKTGWNIAGNSGLVGQEWNNSACPMDNNGEKILRNINTGNYEFKITPVGSWGIAAVNQFSAANVDKDNSTSNIFRNWTSHLFGSYKDGNEYKLPMNNKKDRNVCIQLTNDMAINGKADIKIAFDGAKITVNVLPKYTVSFNSDGGSDVASQTVFEGNTASEPSAPTKDGYTFVKWQLNGSDYNFSTPVTGNITLDAVWAYKAIESVSLNESTHMTWVGNSDFALTPTLTPSDAIAKSVAWSSDVESVATVSGGTVHAVSAGSAIITCTVTDMNDNVRSASCEVTVAACQMIVNNLYSMTVTGYESSTGSSANLNNLWNEDDDNDGPASMTITRLAFQKKDAGKTLYAYDESGTVKVKEDVSGDDVQWILIPVGESYTPSWNSGNACPLYYIKNKATGAYMHRGSLGVSTGNPDWIYSVTNTNATNAATDDYKWFFVYEPGNVNQRCIFVKSGIGSSKAHSYKLHTSNQYNDCTDAYAPKPMLPVGCTADINDYAKSYNNTSDFNYDTYPNPNYKASLMNGSYYRMKENATVRANLNAALVSGAVITVRLYADAATSVKLQKTDGTEIETINLTAGAEREYSYTVASNSALLGENAFVIKAADNHAGIASIVVTRTYAASPSDPALEWETDLSGGVTQSVLSGTFQHIASSTLSSGAIHYISSDETVATVATDGTVTPLVAGNTTITATIEAEGCYAEAYITYNVTLTEASLQQAIDATPVKGTLTLTHDYNDNAKINKAITINGGNHTIGDLKIELSGDLTLSSGLTVRDFTICAKAGNTSTPAASGQVRNATNLTCNGNAYFLYTVDPSGHVQYGWYDFTVPFPVNVMSGIAGIDEYSVLKEDFVNERDYAIMEYLGERKALGQYPYQKFRGVMQPKQLYSITLDNRDNYNTVRFRKTDDGVLVDGDNVTLHAYAGSGVFDNLNGVGNGTLHHADAGNLSVGFVQVYQSGEKTFMTVDKNDYSFVVGTAFMVQVQEAGTMTLSQATHGALLAPSRYESAPATAIQIAREGQPFSDQLFISASETGGQAYTPGTDLAKAGDLGSANVPQIWTTAYNNPLCVHEAQLINGEASYNLSIYAPAADTYTLTSLNIPADYSLYLTQNGTMLTELNGTYTLDLNKGITTEYGLLLVETYKTPTGMEEPMSQESRVKSQKILHNGVLYILHNGKIYNAQGGKVCDL